MATEQHTFGPAGWLPLVVLLTLLLLYMWGTYLQHTAGKKWNKLRVTSFTCGILLCLLALSPPLAAWGHMDFRGHMVQHLLLGMFAPLGLVLAAPITLALRTLPAPTARKITSVLASIPIRYISHPITALMLNIGGMFLLYLTPLYSQMQHYLWMHHLVHFHFFAAGYLFIWAIAGPDPAPKRPALHHRLWVLFISMAAHAYLSKLMFAYQYPQASSHSTIEIEEGAKLMYYGGDLAEILLAIAFFSIWYQQRLHRAKPQTINSLVTID